MGQAHAPGPDRLWADLNMGVWLGRPQSDRRPAPPTEYVRADIAADLLKALERIASLTPIKDSRGDVDDYPQSIARAALSAARATGGTE